MNTRAVGKIPLLGFYALYFATVGISLPFLPAYLRFLGLSGTEVGLLLALGPALALVAPPFWGHLADRTGRPDRVLNVLAVGALLAFLPLLFAGRLGELLGVLALYAFFTSSITTVLDSMALHRISIVGGSYPHLRLFGSIGFVLSSSLFGLWVDEVDRRTVYASLTLMLAYALWSFTLRAQVPPMPSRRWYAGLALLKDPQIAWLLAGTCLHWVACAPYHGTFAIHVGSLGLAPVVVGASASLGVVAEIAVMFLYPRFSERLSPPRLLALAFGASAVRWAGMAFVESGPAIILLQLFHGLTFGAFYVAGVGYISRRVSPQLRASGQALFVSVTFGLGGLIGYTTAGAGYDWLGGSRLFLVAAVLEGVAAALVLRSGRGAE